MGNPSGITETAIETTVANICLTSSPRAIPKKNTRKPIKTTVPIISLERLAMFFRSGTSSLIETMALSVSLYFF